MCYLGLLAPLAASMAVTANQSTYGTLSVVNLAISLVYVPLWVSLGYACGCVLKKGWGVLAGTALWALAIFIPHLLRDIDLFFARLESWPILVISPWWAWLNSWPLTGATYNPAVAHFRLIYFATLTGSIAFALSIFTKRITGDRLRTSVSVISALAPALALTVLGALWRPILVVPTLTEATCDDSGYVCVHPAHIQVLTNLSEIAQAQATLTGHRIHVADVALVDRDVTPTDFGENHAVIEIQRRSSLQHDPFMLLAATDMATSHSGIPACWRQTPAPDDHDVWDNHFARSTTAELVAANLAHRSLAGLATGDDISTSPEPLIPFHSTDLRAQEINSMTNEDFRNWYISHREDIIACNLDIFN